MAEIYKFFPQLGNSFGNLGENPQRKGACSVSKHDVMHAL